MDFAPEVAATETETAIIWMRNSDNNPIGTTGTNMLCQRVIAMDEWTPKQEETDTQADDSEEAAENTSEEESAEAADSDTTAEEIEPKEETVAEPDVVTESEKAIVSVSVCYDNRNTLHIAYLTDEDNDLTTLTDRTIQIQTGEETELVTAEDQVISAPQFAYLNGKDVLLYYLDRNLVSSALNHYDSSETIVPNINTDSFCAVSSGENSAVFWAQDDSDGTAELYGSFYSDGWGLPVRISKFGDCIADFSVQPSEDGSFRILTTHTSYDLHDDGTADRIQTDLTFVQTTPSANIAFTFWKDATSALRKR